MCAQMLWGARGVRVLCAAALVVAVLAVGANAHADAALPVIPLFRHAQTIRRALAPQYYQRWAPRGPAQKSNSAGLSLPKKSSALPHEPVLGDLLRLGEYYVQIRVAGQPINVQLDTGSSTLAVPLKDCRNCLPSEHRFDLSKAVGGAELVSCESSLCDSNTCHHRGYCSACSSRRACCSLVLPNKCGFTLGYADGSGAAGALVRAHVGIAGLAVPLTFGSILHVTGSFESGEVDGILGMAFPSIACNPTCVTPLFDALVAAKKVKRDVFSMCSGPHGGQLILGGSDPSYFEGKLKYAPLISRKEHRFYDVAIAGARVGEHSLKLPRFSVGIVDSGTTVLVVTLHAYMALRQYFQKHYCHVPGLCPPRYRTGKAARVRAKIVRASPEHAALLQNHRAQSKNASAAAAGQSEGDLDDDDDGLFDDFPDLDDGTTWFAPGYCALLSDKDVRLLPSISIELENDVHLTVKPDDYLLKFEQESYLPWERVTYRCLGIQPLNGLEYQENNVIIGDVWLQKFYVEYDRENQRVGFARARNCLRPGQARAAPLDLGTRQPASSSSVSSAPGFAFGLAVASFCAWGFIWYLCNRNRSKNQYESIR